MRAVLADFPPSSGAKKSDPGPPTMTHSFFTGGSAKERKHAGLLVLDAPLTGRFPLLSA